MSEPDPYKTKMWKALDPPKSAVAKASSLSLHVLGKKIAEGEWPVSRNTFDKNAEDTYSAMIAADPITMTRRAADELFTSIPPPGRRGELKNNPAALKTLALFNALMWWLDPSGGDSEDFVLGQPKAPAVHPWHKFLQRDAEHERELREIEAENE